MNLIQMPSKPTFRCCNIVDHNDFTIGEPVDIRIKTELKDVILNQWINKDTYDYIWEPRYELIKNRGSIIAYSLFVRYPENKRPDFIDLDNIKIDELIM